jgi:broad specificity phosphatase PhoE
MKLILVRHGISEHNAGGIVSGSKSDPQLSKAGIANTKKASRFIDETKIDQVLFQSTNSCISNSTNID